MKISRISADFATSPQLHVGDLAAVRGLGFRAVINNRPDGEEEDQPSSAAIGAEAERLGLCYAHIPVSGDPLAEQVQALRQFLATVDGPVLAFCRTGNRSARLWNHAHRPG